MRAWVVPAPALVVAGAAAILSAQSSSQQTPTFRTRTTLRAVEVRVVDQRNRPITDLEQTDFSLFEDGKPQDIKLFARVELSPQPSGAGAPLELRTGDERPGDLTPANRRVFLIVLGRGNLQIPSKGLDGMTHLVRNLLLPQDLVAVMAWNRATDFTHDHSRIAGMLERYKTGHQKVEALLKQHFGGLAAIYGSRDMPDWMSKEIDAVLRGPGAPEMRTILPAAASTSRVEFGIRRNTDLLLGTSSLDVFGAAMADTIGMTLDEYVSTSVQSMQDLTRIYAGLAYLRHVDGEKHMVYVSPSGLHLPSTDDDRSVARLAQDANVVIDILHSDGMSADMWAVASSKNIAEFTGGQFTGLTYGDRFVERIDATTRAGYQLGYYPSANLLDGKYRKVTVKVRRRGLTTLYRQGYYARTDLAPIDRRQVVSQTRVEAALRYGQDVRDLMIQGAAARGRASDGRLQLSVQLNVDPAGVAVLGDGEDRYASLDVAVFCVDRQLRTSYLVGQVWRRVRIALPRARYEQFLKTGVGFTVHVPIRRSANFVKAVVYDYAADKVGTVVPKIK